MSDIGQQSYARYCKCSLKSRSVSLFQLLYNKKESLGNSLYDLVFYESGRQDSNLRPSAPKALYRVSEALGFQAITYLLRSAAYLVRTNYDVFDGILTEFTKISPNALLMRTNDVKFAP